MTVGLKAGESFPAYVRDHTRECFVVEHRDGEIVARYELEPGTVRTLAESDAGVGMVEVVFGSVYHYPTYIVSVRDL